MSLIIRDETANLLLLTCDNAGNFYFGDGTPVSPVTIAGGGIIDSGGFIVHGLNSCSPSPVEGGIDCPIGSTVDVTTLTSRQVTIQLDTHYPAQWYQAVLNDPTDPSQGGRTELVDLDDIPAHIYTPRTGFFQIENRGLADSQVTDPSQPDYYDPQALTDPCGYRWL